NRVGIESRRAPGRKPARDSGNECDRQCCYCERCRVRRTYTEQQRNQQPIHGECASEACDNSDDGEQQTFFHDVAQHVGTISSERKQNAELMPSLGNNVRQHAIRADRRKRPRASELYAISRRITFRPTRLPSRMSVASYTCPIPPCPNKASILYGPKR